MEMRLLALALDEQPSLTHLLPKLLSLFNGQALVLPCKSVQHSCPYNLNFITYNCQ